MYPDFFFNALKNVLKSFKEGKPNCSFVFVYKDAFHRNEF